MIWIFDRVCPITPLPLSSLLVITLLCGDLTYTDMMYLLWACKHCWCGNLQGTHTPIVVCTVMSMYIKAMFFLNTV